MRTPTVLFLTRWAHLPAPAVTVAMTAACRRFADPQHGDGLEALVRYSDAKGRCLNGANHMNQHRRPSTPFSNGQAPVVHNPPPRPSHDCRMSEKLGRFERSVIVFEIHIAVAEATDTRCSGVDNLLGCRRRSLILWDFAVGGRREGGVDDLGFRKIRSSQDRSLVRFRSAAVAHLHRRTRVWTSCVRCS